MQLIAAIWKAIPLISLSLRRHLGVIYSNRVVYFVNSSILLVISASRRHYEQKEKNNTNNNKDHI